MTGQSKEATLNSLMMTHYLRHEAARTYFFSTEMSPMAHTSQFSAHRDGGGQFEQPHVLGYRKDPPPNRGGGASREP